MGRIYGSITWEFNKILRIFRGGADDPFPFLCKLRNQLMRSGAESA